MKRIVLTVAIASGALFSNAQNVGIGTISPTNKLHVAGITRSDTIAIGTSTPRSPLSFGTLTGQKITLWDDGNVDGNNYGIGVQGGLLQFHSYTAVDNIAFGYGKSTAMTERMRIINSGGDGLALSGRITLKNGTNPIDINYGSGVWMYKADNTALLGFMGVQNNQNLGFYGGPGGWGFTYDAINSRVGIGTSTPLATLMVNSAFNPQMQIRQTNTGDFARIRMQTGTSRYWDIASYNDAAIGNERLNFYNSQAGDIMSITGSGFVGIGTTNPNAPLGFPASIGKKVTLYPGANGNLGLGVYSNELRIHTDDFPADITFGYENTNGFFAERFRVKGSGAIAVNGSTGSAGQLLMSNGNGAPPQWIPKTDILNAVAMSETFTILPTPGVFVGIAGSTININASVPGKIALWVNTSTTYICTNPLDACTMAWQLKTMLDGVEAKTSFIQVQTQLIQPDYDQTVGPIILPVSTGAHSINLRGGIISIVPGIHVRVSAYAQFIPD